MLHSAKQLHGYKLGALDGEIGHVKGFYFDDKDWVIRYLVADTGAWIPGRKVLISPYALGDIYSAGKLLEVNLTRDKIENSPSIDTQLPVVRQHERDYYRYYNWPIYWGGPALWGLNPIPIIPPSFEPMQEKEPARETTGDSHLRSTQEVIGFNIQALDGEIGHVEDFLIDDQDWAVRDLIVATGNWWSGKNVLVPPQSIDKVSWEESRVLVHLTRSEVQHEPAYEYSVSG
jgi:PRC-barrel domain